MKQTIKLKESQLRRMIMKALNEKLYLTEDICIGKGGGYYGDSPIFRVCVDNGNGTYYLFSPPGWDFDTQSQLEAAAICCHSNKSFLSELLNSPELNQLPVVTPSDNDKIEALYWLTGGNVEWTYGYWSEHGCKWNDETIKLLMGDADIIGMLDNAVSSSKSFAELVSHLREGEYMVYANDILPLQYDDEEGAQEPLQESKLRAIIKEGIQKVLNEEYGVDIKDTLAWVQKKHPDMSPEEQERFAKNIINKREHDNYVFDMHMATSGGGDGFKRELTWDEAKRCYMKYGRYIDEISYKDKRYGPYAEWNEFNPKAFFDEDGE